MLSGVLLRAIRDSVLVGLVVGVAAAWADPVVIRDVRITNDRTVDCTSVARIIDDIIRPGMTDRQKAEACWEFLRLRTFHKSPGLPTPEMGNPATILNLHGQMQCGPCGGMLSALMREAGLPADIARGQGHVITEVFYEGAWHMYDADMHNYSMFEDGTVASVYQIANTPDLLFGPKRKSYPWFNGHDWLTGLVKLYTRSASLPFDTPRPTDAAYVASKRKNPAWQYRYQLDLRPGQEIVWSWYPDPDVGYARVNYIPDDMVARAARDEAWPDAMRGGFATAPIPSLAGFGANGRLTCELSSELAVDKATNVRFGPEGVRQVDASKAGSFELTLALPYYFADGWVAGRLPAQGLTIEGRSGDGAWRRLWPVEGRAPGKRLRLYELLNCAFGATLRFTFAADGGAACEGLGVVGVFHHNFAVLPALLKGRNAITVHGGDAALLAKYPLLVSYVYDRLNDRRQIVRTRQAFGPVTSPGARFELAEASHWPLMREIRVRCATSPVEAIKPEPAERVTAFTDWGSYPFSKASQGVNYWQDFERGDLDGWRGALVTGRTHRGSDFALTSDLKDGDGRPALKVIRNIGALNCDTHMRFAVYVEGAQAINLVTQDRTDVARPGQVHDGPTEANPNAWYTKSFTGLRQGRWNVLECGVDEMVSEKYPGRALPARGRLAGFYISAIPAAGVRPEDVTFVIDDFICYDAGVMAADPLAMGADRAR